MSTKRKSKRFVLKQPSTTTNSMNEVTGDPTEYLRLWGNVVDGSGNETKFGEQMQHTGQVQIEVSYPRSGRFPQPEDLVTWSEFGRTRTVNLKHVKRKDGRGRELILIGTEV